jgi:hypothetical protein
MLQYLSFSFDVGRIVNSVSGRAIVQAVNRWLLIAATRVRARVWLSGISGE